MAKLESIIVAEFDSPTNASYLFAPLQRVVRGRFDLHRVKEPQAGKLLSKWPEAIPGQRVEFDYASGSGFIVEPLHEERYAAIRSRIEALGQSLPEERKPFQLDAATFHFWLEGLVATGDAKVLQGRLPESVPGTPRTRFRSSEQRDPIDKLTAAIEKQSEQQAKLLDMLTVAIGKLSK